MSATSWMSGHVSERHASSATNAAPAATSVLAAEIGLNDPLIGLDGARRSFGDLLAVVEDEYHLAESHDDLHVVLDEQHQCRVGHEHAHELDELLLAVGEIAGVLAGQRPQPHEVQELAPAALGLAQRAARDDEQVLQRRQLGEDVDDLEGAAD